MQKNDPPVFGLIGNPVSHSRSPEIFNKFFETENLAGWSYRLFPLSDISGLMPLLEKETSVVGLNVTIPFKESVIPLATTCSPEVMHIGAANTLLIERKQEKIIIHAENTDCAGFEKSLKKWKLPIGIKALILGTGGAAKAAAFVLKKMNIPFQMVSRSKSENSLIYENTGPLLPDYKLIIQTTPLGMWPDTEAKPALDYNCIGPEHFCFDMIYRPEKTNFLLSAEKNGASVRNGAEMLQLQAEKAWELFKIHTF